MAKQGRNRSESPPGEPSQRSPTPGQTAAHEAASQFVVTRAGEELSRAIATAHRPGLHLVATPIGNLSDITLRAIATLCTADIVYAEDTRHSGRLLHHFAITAKLRPYHEHNAERERPAILEALANGASIALVSDAGTPLVSDPGYKLVRDCLDAGHAVDALPGPSAALSALITSGLPTDAFGFFGFPPARTAARRSRLNELARLPMSLVFFEAAQRLPDTLADLADCLGDRPAAVARELTKLNEEVARGTLSELAREFIGRDKIKGEIAIVVAPPMADWITDKTLTAALVTQLATATLKDAVRAVSDTFDVPRKRVYDLALSLKSTTSESDGGGP